MEIEKILNECVDKETGEITDEAFAKVDELQEQLGVKALHIAAYMKGEEAEAEAVAKVGSKLAARAKIHKNRAARLKKYLQSTLEKDRLEFSDSRVTIKWRGSSKCIVSDESEIFMDPGLVSRTVSVSPDLPAIKAEAKRRKAAKETPLKGVTIKSISNIQIS